MKLKFSDVYGTPMQAYDQPPRPHDIAIRRHLHALFADWQIEPEDQQNPDNAIHHTATVAPNNPGVPKRLAALREFVEKSRNFHATFDCALTAAEAKRARWARVWPLDGVHRDKSYKLLNKWPKFRCDACGRVNLTVMPELVIISNVVRQPSKVRQQVFQGDGWFVVRARLRDVIQSAIGDQVEIGSCIVQGEEKKAVEEAQRLYWVRPRAVLDLPNPSTGDPDWEKETCPKCGDTFLRYAHRPQEARDKAQKPWDRPGLFDRRQRLANLPSGDIAMGEWRQRNSDNDMHHSREVYMSGALAAFLKTQGAVGLLIKDSGREPECVWPADDSPPLVEMPREFNALASASAAAKKKQGKAVNDELIVKQLNDVPWDHEKDGFVYLHLTTRDLVMLDPMTMDEPATFRVPKFKPGLWRFPVGAIRQSDRATKTVAVDSASLAFVDAAFLPNFEEQFDWYSMTEGKKNLAQYCADVAKRIGHRFGYCTAPGIDSGYDFEGDGGYTLDLQQLEFVDVAKVTLTR